ncbi:PREDICTED: sepiapterin reductase-like [Nanorana parkeri]|uniref:sepiapterin reductase-like n=1 Tax=Nanorana parkeri TaxID=125878 RepID=UPI000854A5AA|nr:PREDICTED: sepiapterin reductase-like [Nanorana parkeri]
MIRQSREMRSNGHVDATVHTLNGHNGMECSEGTKSQNADFTMHTTNGHSSYSLGTVVCVITGASRGLGRSLAWELCPRVMPGSALLLVARTEQALRLLAEELTLQYPEIKVRWVAADLGTEDGVRRAVQAAQELNGRDTAQRVIIINNAGSMGDITKSFVDFTDPLEVNRYFSFNVSSALCLTSSLLKVYRGRPGLQRLVVNVTSLAALQPFKSWTLYCAGKAAREMMFKVLAMEEPDVRVLIYAPGPLDNIMQDQVQSHTHDLEVRQHFITMKKSGQLVDCSVSAKKMMDILEEDTFKSGDHVDFFD